MARVKHLYTGHGNPNDNPDLQLEGDQVGNHLYQDLSKDNALWIAYTYEDEGQIYHDAWRRMVLAPNLKLKDVEIGPPDFEGQLGRTASNELFIGMYHFGEGASRWMSMGTSLGGWYQEP